MKMTLEIPDSLFREVKAKAALEGRKLKDVVADSLRAHLAAKKALGARRKVVFPIIKGKPGALRLSDEQIAQIEDQQEAAVYAGALRH